MKNPKHLQLLINVVGAFVGLFVVGYIVFAALHREAVETCSSQYPAPMRFSLQNGEGKPLSAIELQARAGSRDLGVIDNASVVRIEGGPSPEALEVKLRKLPAGADAGATVRNGIEFHWSPPGMKNASSACLGYSVWLPEKFEFGAGGLLPGVYSRGQSAASNPAYSVYPQWDNTGRPLIGAVLEGGTIARLAARTNALPFNRWVRIDQEIVLNDAGKANGLARLWVDGNLVIDDHTLALRRDAGALLSGVSAAVGYKQVPAQPGLLRLSPFEISWR
jgi:hypothetical protein